MSAEAKHTPGPWQFNQTLDESLVEALVTPGESQTYYAPICFLDTEWTEEAWKANARLIAAAPDLLEGSTRLIQLLHNLADLYDNAGARKALESHAAKTLRAAIQAAKGEQ